MYDYFKKSSNALEHAKYLIPQMRDSCAPLFCNSQINNFGYLRIYKDGRVLNLTTEEKWIEHRFEKKIKYKILFEEALLNAKINKPHIYLWPTNITDPLLSALHDFNIWNGCNFYILYENYVEIFSFASSREENNMHNFYVNNLDNINAFIIYIKENINKTIDHGDKNLFIQTDLVFPAFNCKPDPPHFPNFNQIQSPDQPKRVHFPDGYYLTPREIECCNYLLQGDTVKAIAKKLSLSPRTIEAYINNIKNKTNCLFRNELVNLFNENRWIFEAVMNMKTMNK